jgi:hypothetical protein
VALAGEHAEQVAHLQVGDVGHGRSVGPRLFHRQAPRAPRRGEVLSRPAHTPVPPARRFVAVLSP